MKNQCSSLLCFVVALLMMSHTRCLLATDRSFLVLGGEKQGWKVIINPSDGVIREYQQKRNKIWESVPFREDSLAGLAWKGIRLRQSQANPYSFYSTVDSVLYSVVYKEASDHLIAECSLTNNRRTVFEPECTRLHIGINSEMKSFPEWDSKFFPTLLRCEKNFAWGYFMSPRQVIMGIGVEEPVASYTLNYIYEGILDWKWGHQILTASLDFLHCLPLPERHPRNLTSLHPGETKSWTIHLGVIDQLSGVKKELTKWVGAPMIECERYSLVPGEDLSVSVCSADDLKSLRVEAPDGKLSDLLIKKTAKNLYAATLSSTVIKGMYRITATAENGKMAEASVYVRHPWSWYLKNARDFVADYPPLFSNSCETFYGYYTAFLAARHFPDPKDKKLIERFNRTLSQFVDTVNWVPVEGAQPDRVQNFSSLMGMLVDLWETTGHLSYLEKAARIGDYLCSARIQAPDGSYRSKGVHYTAVIYPAKSMLELASAEKQFANEPLWNDRYARHQKSAYRAIDDLLLRLDDIQTEGDMTFEDGMITCSALQLALRGLVEENDSIRTSYTDAAIYLMNKHRCLEQLLIPDTRMRGGTLRYWEALDIYFVPNQAMSSPHGWTAWKIYASYYLYLLTGEVSYLADFMDTLGACAQIMDSEGHLRWAFVTDPYIKGQVCIEKQGTPNGWIPEDSVVGEQYLDMISPWLRPDDEDKICAFGEKGGAGDNTVQEIFKAMEECVLTSAYVVVGKDSKVRSWNCTTDYRDGILHIYPCEEIIRGIHLNTSMKVNVKVHSDRKIICRDNCKGMLWLGSKPALIN